MAGILVTDPFLIGNLDKLTVLKVTGLGGSGALLEFFVVFFNFCLFILALV